MHNPGHEEWWGYSPMILPMYSKVLLGYVLTILHSPSEACESVRPPTCSSNAHTNQDISLLARDFRDGFLVWEGIPILQNINHIRGPDRSTAQPPSSSLSCKVASWSWTAMEIGPPFEANATWAQLEIFGESMAVAVALNWRCWKKRAVNIKSLLG